jgi:hypothetical protein
MNKYKYQFKIEEINLREKNFNDKDYGNELLEDKELMKSVMSYVGLPISIVLDDPEEFPNEGTVLAKNQAEDKASEIIATTLGITYGGSQKHLKNYREDADIQGKFAYCRLQSIEQLS